MAAPILSISLIFRDDIRSIEKCLKALTPLRQAVPCELIMADTGSVDGSRQIAEKYADRVIDFPWIQDFAAARNAALDQCSGLWNLVVDTDEYLTEDISQLRDFLLNPENLYYQYGFVVIRNYYTDEMVAGEGEDCIIIRLFQRDYRFTGKIHESVAASASDPIIHLDRTVFDHDGYSRARIKKKKNRNLKLIQEELEKAPGDLRRIDQCLDSSVTEEQERSYALMAEEWIRRPDNKEPSFGATVLRTAVMKGRTKGWPEVERWVETAREYYPDSPVTQVDISYYSAMHNLCYFPEKALADLDRYEEGIRKYDNHEYTWEQLYAGTLKGELKSSRQMAKLARVQALRELKRWPEAAEQLGQIDISDYTEVDQVGKWLVNLADIWWRSRENMIPILRSGWNQLKADASNLEEERKKYFLQAGCTILDTKTEDQDIPEDARSAAELFGALEAEHPLKIAAELIEEEDPARMQERLSQVQQWQYVPGAAIENGIRLGVKFPQSFYRVSLDVGVDLVCRLQGRIQEKLAETAVSWYNALSDPDLYETAWLYRLTLSAVLGELWQNGASRELADAFGKISRRYMENMYAPAMLTEENLQLLPAELRFGFYHSRALCAQDDAEYIRLLRKGLQEMPAMKAMVSWLCSQVQEKIDQENRQQQELLALAQQVKLLLSVYPPEHPAVAALLQSDAYQKIAHLLN